MRFLDRLSVWCAYAGVALLVSCAILTVGDILFRKSVGLTLVGLIDLSQLLVMAAVFLWLPLVYAEHGNIAVDLVHARLSPHWTRRFDILWLLVSILFLLILTWYGGAGALDAIQDRESSPTLAIPMISYWVPMLVGCVMSTLICVGQLILLMLPQPRKHVVY